jgi:plasmid maintenance system antidote protein VapI
MLPNYTRVKGIHPGAILKRELRKRNLKSIELAISIGEHPQTINAITKERRGINPKLSIKLGEYFSIEHDYFMLLQASFLVSKTLNSQNSRKNQLKEKFRAALFWDTDIESIDPEKNRGFIIRRVLERGNEQEITALINMYTLPIIKKEIDGFQDAFVPNYKRNIEKYILKSG